MMKYLNSASIFSALIIVGISILGVTVSVTSNADVTSDSHFIVPLEPNSEFYACFLFPFCFDPENAMPLQHQPELDLEITAQQV